MTVLSVVKDVCATIGVLAPDSIFSSINTNRTMFEMLALANEMAQRIAYNNREWGKLIKVQTFTGNGIAAEFNLPADFQRMLLSGNIWRSTNTLNPMRFVPDVDEWLNRRARNIYDPYGEWTTFGDQITFAPILGVGITAYFPYLEKNCVALASGGNGDRFIADNDSFRLNERLLKLGMIFQWKAQKGSAYQEDMGTYEDALAYEAGHDTPSPIIISRTPISSSARLAYPWPVPTS